MAKYSLVITPESTPCRLAGCIIQVYISPIRIHALVHLLTYLHIWLCAYKTGNISETVEDRVKVTINGLYKVVHGLSIAAKLYDLESPLSETQGQYSLNAKNDEIYLSNDPDAMYSG